MARLRIPSILYIDSLKESFHFMSRVRKSVSLFFAFGRRFPGRRFLAFALGARFCRGLLGDRFLGSRLFLRGLRRFRLAACGRGLDHLLALGAWSDSRLIIVGQDLGDAQHRDLVAIAALAAR